MVTIGISDSRHTKMFLRHGVTSPYSPRSLLEVPA